MYISYDCWCIVADDLSRLRDYLKDLSRRIPQHPEGRRPINIYCYYSGAEWKDLEDLRSSFPDTILIESDASNLNQIFLWASSGPVELISLINSRGRRQQIHDRYGFMRKNITYHHGSNFLDLVGPNQGS